MTEISGKKISFDVVTIPEVPNDSNCQGTPHEMPNGDNGQGNPPEKPNGDNGQNTPPEKNGESGNGETPPDVPGGQGFSSTGDAKVGSGSFRMVGGKLISENGGLFYTTNTTSHILLSGVEIGNRRTASICFPVSETPIHVAGVPKERMELTVLLLPWANLLTERSFGTV